MRILLADDAALLREALQALLERLGHHVIATAADATELVTVYEALPIKPDLVITDVRMPPTRTDDGLRAALTIRAAHPTQPILALSQYVADRYARDLLALPEGAVGYLLKERVNRVTDFEHAINTIAKGGTVIDSEVTRHLLQRDQPHLIDYLTEREREVLTLMAEGASNSDIAARLFISDAAVRKHIGNIFTGLGLHPADENRRVRAILTFLQTQT
ncbi:two-component system response regulator [Microbacterium esteraromaticum]|uniref:Two-component system response regulator n=1 Tax=Microbacterium esteraromaticum TaxID=57043 RepID=A0A1R4I799_9MICO|nr:response regulator transcription factor [Microbacterium esteraromaticum]SJN15668.1 two-component system response regulator [Microbacterium esteraromaticum]